MSHTPQVVRTAGFRKRALLALLVAAAPAAAWSVPANPPAKPALGGAAARVGPGASEEIQGILHLGSTLTDRGAAAVARGLPGDEDFRTAEIAFWQVLHRVDASAAEQSTALLGLAHMYRRMGGKSLIQAAAIYERFIKDRPDDDRLPDALLELGRTQRDIGAYHLALNRFYNVINSTLKFPPQGFEHYQQLAKTAQFEIAQTYFEAGDYAEAGKYFLKVRLLDLAASDRAHAHFMAAFSQQMAHDFEASASTLRSYLSEWPEDSNVPEARYLLATLLRQLKRPQEALAVTLDLLKEEHGRVATDPRRWSYWQRRTGNEVANEFFQTGDIFNALAIYQGLNSLGSDPQWRVPVTYQIALCYERLGQVEKARQSYGAVIASGTASAANPAPSSDAVELARMATWRLAHLDWHDTVDHQFSTFFNLNQDAPAPKPPPPARPPPFAHPS